MFEKCLKKKNCILSRKKKNNLSSSKINLVLLQADDVLFTIDRFVYKNLDGNKKVLGLFL